MSERSELLQAADSFDSINVDGDGLCMWTDVANALGNLRRVISSHAPCTREPVAGNGRVHHLKTWPQYFNEVLSGRKLFEWRVNDRAYEAGDTLILQEWEPARENLNNKEGRYTGREISKVVTYVFSPFPVQQRTVVMSLTDAAPPPQSAASTVPVYRCGDAGCMCAPGTSCDPAPTTSPEPLPWGEDQATDDALAREEEADRLFAEHEAKAGRAASPEPDAPWTYTDELIERALTAYEATLLDLHANAATAGEPISVSEIRGAALKAAFAAAFPRNHGEGGGPR